MGRAVVTLGAPALAGLLVDIFAAHGCAPDEARAIADHLVEADLCGHPSHGAGLAPTYVRSLAAGLVRANRRPVPVPAAGAMLVFDGEGGFGQSLGLAVADLAAEAVARSGIAVFALRNVHHLGRIAAYGERLAGAGAVSVLFVNTVSRPLVALHGGRHAWLGTNPVCITIPRPDGDPIVLDFATSAIAVGKVRVALELGVPAPDGTLIDADGRPTRDPAVMYTEPSGALLPVGGHKGGGLNVVCELLASLVLGATMGTGPPGMIVNTLVGMAFAADAVAGAPAALNAALAHVLASPMRDGGAPVLPGDPERRSRRRLLQEGLPMPRATWDAIVALGRALALDETRMRAVERGAP